MIIADAIMRPQPGLVGGWAVTGGPRRRYDGVLGDEPRDPRRRAVVAGQTLFDKIWNRHVVTEKHGQTLLYVDRHLLHDGSFCAFNELRKRGLKVRRPDQTFATPDPDTPTHSTAIDDSADPRSRQLARSS